MGLFLFFEKIIQTYGKNVPAVQSIINENVISHPSRVTPPTPSPALPRGIMGVAFQGESVQLFLHITPIKTQVGALCLCPATLFPPWQYT